MNIIKQFDDKYEKNQMQGGTTCCPGCGGPLFWRLVCEVMGPNTIVFGDGPCSMCAMRNIKLPLQGMHFNFVADVSTGIVRALRAKGREDIVVISSAGDGGAADIGFGKLSGAAERNENMIQVTIDNEAYMNTGIQKSGATPFGAWTTTTPVGNESLKKNLPMMMAQHNIPYVATVSVSYPKDLQNKIEKAKGINGFKYLHCVIPCPTGWRFNPAKSIEVMRLSTETWTWPLYEIEYGVFKLTLKPKQKPVDDYLKTQNRFRNLTNDQIKSIQNDTDNRRQRYLENDGKNIIL